MSITGNRCRPDARERMATWRGGRPAEQRRSYDAILAHLLTLGPVHEDAVGVWSSLSAVASWPTCARGLAISGSTSNLTG